MTIVQVFLDKHQAKARVSELESDKKRKDWYNIVKYDVVDQGNQETKAPESESSP